MADDAPDLAQILDQIKELENLCAQSERALAGRDWPALTQLMADQRRITHGIQVAMDAAGPARDQAFDAAVFRRLRSIYAFRENHLSRMQKYRGMISERLQLLSRWKQVARGWLKGRSQSRLGSLDKIR